MINEIIETVQAAGGSFIARMRVSDTSATAAGQDAAWLSLEHAQAKDKVGHWLRREAIRFAAADDHQHQSISRAVKGHKEVARRKVDSHYTKTTDEDPGKDDNQTTDDLEAAETYDSFEPVVLEQVGSTDVNIETERVLQGNTDALLATLNSIVFDDLEEQVTNNDQ